MSHQLVAGYMEEEQKSVEIEHEQNERQQQLEEDSTPEIPVVRTNTPRPFSFETFVAQSGQVGPIKQIGWQHDTREAADEMLSTFPHEAPSAPPVPEEVGEADEQDDSVHTSVAVESTPLPLAPTLAMVGATEQEFVWLFEYGMEMDFALLNSSDRLNDAALLYGPAVLKGYTLAFAVIESQQQKVVATIAPSPAHGAEVWGVVYRIPRRLIEQDDNELSQLDRVHGVVPPGNVFERIGVVVTESYRGRELSCLAYITMHLPHIQARQVADTQYLQRLLEIARKQKLPDDYLQTLIVSSMNSATTSGLQSMPTEQNTEPLPVVGDKQNTSLQTSSVEQEQPVQPVRTTPLPQSRITGLVVFASFSSILLLSALALAVIQGLGIAGDTFTSGFTPLNVPWYVLLYGLIGGCISCLVTLGRHNRRTEVDLPVFVIIVGCSRPFIGVVLAMLSYLLLNTGLFAPLGNPAQHVMLSSLLAALLGFCENWLFKKQIV
ncbi:MAG TPA: gamma-glutamylcyclotransferase family protein [Ktedonobacteraceae bacterium]|nr:gamma-glutamylcyclotransferase family protein [Ktedonobacteraceae bacterium]